MYIQHINNNSIQAPVFYVKLSVVLKKEK